jgi:hypothetical protein
LAGRVRFSFQLRALSTLRNLTLGVLIVTGGTLAALPFRRSPAIPDASTHFTESPTQATGTLDSALDSTAKLAAEFASPHTTPVHVAGSRGSQLSRSSAKHLSGQEIPGFNEFIREQSPAEASDYVMTDRRASAIKPLTYEDLMAPIARPESIKDRYQAIAAVGSEVPTRSEGLAMGSRPIERLVPELRSELQQRFTSIKPREILQSGPSEPSNEGRAGGSLASSINSSSMVSRSMIPRTPSLPDLSQAPVSDQPNQRQHHWIVQP